MEYEAEGQVLKPIFSTRDICANYTNKAILNNVSIDIFGGEVHALVGNHDEGKSCFCKVICGDLDFERGYILNSRQQKYTRKQLKKVIEIVWEEPIVFEKLSIAENIVIGTSYAKWNLVYRKKKPFNESSKLA